MEVKKMVKTRTLIKPLTTQAKHLRIQMSWICAESLPQCQRHWESLRQRLARMQALAPQAALEKMSHFGISVRFVLCFIGTRRVDRAAHLCAVKAVGEFMEDEDLGNGRPPLSGFLPDMTAATSIFVKLQQAYKTRASADAAVLRALMDALLSKAGLSPESVPDAQFATWCKSAQFVDVIRYAAVLFMSRHLDDSRHPL